MGTFVLRRYREPRYRRRVGCLYLYHHDPNYADDQVNAIHRDCLQIIRERGSDMVCRVGREGLIVDL